MGRNKNCVGEQTKPQGAKHNVTPRMTNRKQMTTVLDKGGRMTQKCEITRGVQAELNYKSFDAGNI